MMSLPDRMEPNESGSNREGLIAFFQIIKSRLHVGEIRGQGPFTVSTRVTLLKERGVPKDQNICIKNEIETPPKLNKRSLD